MLGANCPSGRAFYLCVGTLLFSFILASCGTPDSIAKERLELWDAIQRVGPNDPRQGELILQFKKKQDKLVELGVFSHWFGEVFVIGAQADLIRGIRGIGGINDGHYEISEINEHGAIQVRLWGKQAYIASARAILDAHNLAHPPTPRAGQTTP